jgi:hypothetical protein
MVAEKDYHIGAEPDLKGSANRHILAYFALLGLLLFLTIIGLTIMFRFQVDHEKEEKIGQLMKSETLQSKTESESLMSGKKGLFLDKKFIPIDEAMKRFLNEQRREK